MNRYFLFVVISVFIIATAELGALATTVTPAQATPTQLWLFFTSLTITLGILLAPIWHNLKKTVISKRMRVSATASLRQTLLFSLIIVVGLFFNSLKILTLWDIIPLGISMVLIEFFFQADKTRSQPSHVSPS